MKHTMRCLIAVLLPLLAAPAGAAKRPVTLDDVMSPPPGIAGKAASAIVWSPDGKHFVVTENQKLTLYEARSGKTREIIDLNKLEGAAVKPAAKDGPFGWTNRHVADKPLQWFPDNRHLLVAAGGDLFQVDSEKGSFEALIQTAEEEQDPRLSPDGRMVAFRRRHNLNVLDLATKQTQTLTSDGSDTLLNGEADWVYPEELDLDRAYWWSPDSSSIAYLQFDVSREPLYPHASLLTTHPVAEPERYPKAGDPNADVRLGVVRTSGGGTRWMDLGDPRDNLLARVVWSPTSKDVLAVRMNRIQTRLDMLLANAASGVAKIVVHEEDPKWLNLRDAPAFLSPDRILYMSERTGFFHLFVHDAASGTDRQLTTGNWEVGEIVAASQEHGIAFTSTEKSPLERHIYQIAADGSGKRQLTSGEGTHAISMSPAYDLFMDDYSGLSAPPASVLRDANGAQVRLFRRAVEQSDLDLLPVQIMTFKTKDGAELYARMIQPPDFQAGKKYPVIVVVYGGPGSQQIHNSWTGASWEQALAHKGFVIWQVDNRGSTGRGHAFELPIYHALGKQELADQREGIEYLLSKGFVDPARIGMYGWSYGGFMTLYTALNAPGLLKAAVAGAPVTNWRNYDSIYTERYMGLPGSDSEAYRLAAPLTKASELQGTALLIAHNIEDDNVHFQNTMQMANAFELAGKRFFMVLYPGKSHGVTGAFRKQMLDEFTQFFVDHL